MRESGLMEVEKILVTDDGRKTEFVRSKCKAFSIDLSGPELLIDAEFAQVPIISVRHSRLPCDCNHRTL